MRPRLDLINLLYKNSLFSFQLLFQPLPFLPFLLAPNLILSPDGNILGSKIAKGRLQHLLHNPTTYIIHNHDGRHRDLEIPGERHQAQFLIDFRDEFRGAGKRDSGDEDKAPVHAAVFSDSLAERAALVVDGKGGDLLD